MDAYRVYGMSSDEMKEISEAYMDYVFKEGEESTFNLLGTRADVLRYQTASLKMALESGWMWAVGEDRNAYIAIIPPGWKPRLSLLLKFPFILMSSVRILPMMRLMKLVKNAGPSLSDRLKKRKQPFVHVAMLCVRKPYWRMGYMRKALEIAKKMADEEGIPLVLETDESLKVERYRHLGLDFAGERRITETIRLYDMVYFPEKTLIDF